MHTGAYLAAHRLRIERALASYLPPASRKPATLHKAMRYSLLDGGKRLRPILCIAAAECCGATSQTAIPLACAIECIHTYSLIHDDLPCMDDDDLRRGKPTSHAVFGEAIALLAGDALLTKAFEIASGAPPAKRYPAAAYIAELAAAAGHLNLIAGQVADMEAEGRTIPTVDLRFIHNGKTAALLAVSLRLGAMAANAVPTRVHALGEFGRHLGLAFQIVDDILDITQPSEKLGKSAGKDREAGKATYPALLGLDASQREATRLTQRALQCLEPFGPKARTLRAIAESILQRDS